MNGEEGQDGTWFNAEKALELGLVSEIETTSRQDSLEESLANMDDCISDDLNFIAVIDLNVIFRVMFCSDV